MLSVAGVTSGAEHLELVLQVSSYEAGLRCGSDFGPGSKRILFSDLSR
jgi:hypothetical protein